MTRLTDRWRFTITANDAINEFAKKIWWLLSRGFPLSRKLIDRVLPFSFSFYLTFYLSFRFYFPLNFSYLLELLIILYESQSFSLSASHWLFHSHFLYIYRYWLNCAKFGAVLFSWSTQLDWWAGSITVTGAENGISEPSSNSGKVCYVQFRPNISWNSASQFPSSSSNWLKSRANWALRPWMFDSCKTKSPHSQLFLNQFFKFCAYFLLLNCFSRVASVCRDLLLWHYMFSWFVLDLTATLYIALVCRQLPFCRYSYFVFRFLVKIVANFSY